MSKNKFDYIIVGSGIEAFLKAIELESNGLHGCLIEKENSWGGLHKGIALNESLLESHLSYLPANDSLVSALQKLRSYIPSVTAQKIDLGPLTFNNGQLQPFLGFGETSNEAVDLYSEFTSSEQWIFSQNIPQIVQQLKSLYQGELINLSEVTSLELNPEAFVKLNGTTQISAKDIYFFDSPLKLSQLLTHSQSSLPKNLVQKLAKTTLWTSVNLVYQHQTPVTQTQAMHVLYGAKEQPCIGRFQTEGELPTSQWLCLVSSEVAADSESLGSTIREMKKQLKRVYPNFFDTVTKENIIISPDSYGRVNPQLLDNYCFPKVAHLYVGSKSYAPLSGLAGDLTSVSTSQPSNDYSEIDAQIM